MRRPEPWYWSARKAWYVQINGKQAKLGPAEKKTKTPPDDVMLEYHRIMSTGGMLTEAEKTQAVVPLVVESFIESKSANRPKSIEACVYYLEPFAARFKTRRLHTFKLEEIKRFVNGQATWSDGTKHNAFAYIKGLFRWARDAGYLEASPLAGVANPHPVGRREQGISLDEFAQLIEATKDDAFRRVLRFLRDTGCRPGELCVITANHLNAKRAFARLGPKEHKTGSRTGKAKMIYLTSVIDAELRDLARQHPTGPLLRNTKGEPWNDHAIFRRFERLRVKLGMPSHVVPYASRHGFLTRLIEMGTPLALAVKIAGHSRVDTLQEIYLHLEADTALKAVDDAAKSIGAEKPSVNAERIAQLEAELAALRASG